MKNNPSLESVLSTTFGHPWRDHAPLLFLLSLGEIVSSTDYAVRHFYDPWHPKFFGNRGEVIHAVNRGIHRINDIAYDRAIRLCDQWENSSREGAEQAIQRGINNIVDGLKRFKESLRDMSFVEADGFCRALTSGVSEWNATDAFEFEQYDIFLESLGYLYVEFDDELVIRSPKDLPLLPDRLSKQHSADLCAMLDTMRQGLQRPIPQIPRSDYVQLVSAISEFINRSN